MFEGSRMAHKYKIKKCECPSGKMMRFVEPCMLLFLSQKTYCGYELMTKLDRFGFSKAKPDPAMVYRTLRYLEKEGFVESRWDTGKAGPAKRNYILTKKGMGLLHLWAENIETRKRIMGKFIVEYGKLFKNS